MKRGNTNYVMYYIMYYILLCFCLCLCCCAFLLCCPCLFLSTVLSSLPFMFCVGVFWWLADFYWLWTLCFPKIINGQSLYYLLFQTKNVWWFIDYMKGIVCLIGWLKLPEQHQSIVRSTSTFEHKGRCCCSFSTYLELKTQAQSCPIYMFFFPGWIYFFSFLLLIINYKNTKRNGISQTMVVNVK